VRIGLPARIRTGIMPYLAQTPPRRPTYRDDVHLPPVELVFALVAGLLIAWIWASVVYEADEAQLRAVEAAQRENANLAIAFEAHTLRTLGEIERIAALVQTNGHVVRQERDIGRILADENPSAGILPLVHVLDERGRVVAGPGRPRSRNAPRHAVDRRGRCPAA
jgi:hypothetical protein